jgi:hypothetical protein
MTGPAEAAKYSPCSRGRLLGRHRAGVLNQVCYPHGGDTMSEEASRLLLSNYRFMAVKVLEVLRGQYSIKNSRYDEPVSIAKPVGKVIGLCGQGGRHPYFEIDQTILIQNLEDISNLDLDPDGHGVPGTDGGVSTALDQLLAICSNLRAATLFATSTGCVNDICPAIVPLLPPDEAWAGDVELPLEIWRLISADVDLVFSAVASKIPLAEATRGTLLHSSLAFADMMRRIRGRTVTFRVDEAALPTTFAGTVGADLVVPLWRLLFEAGCLLIPLSSDSDVAAWYPIVRYLHWFLDGSDIFIKKAFRDERIDSRYRGVFSEEMAVAMMSVVLQERFKAIRINNTSEVLGGGIVRDDPIADFIAKAAESTGRRVGFIAESKGSIGDEVSQSRKRRAKEQVERTSRYVIPDVDDAIKLTFCSTLRYEGQRRRTHCLVTDPEGGEDRPVDAPDPVQMWRAMYAKALRFIGLESASRQVSRGLPAPSLAREGLRLDERDREPSLRQATLRRFDVNQILDIGDASVVMDRVIFDLLLRGLNNEGIRALEFRLAARLSRRAEAARFGKRGLSFVNTFGLGILGDEDTAGSPPESGFEH